MGTSAQTRATARHIKNNTKTFVVRCDIRKDANIIEFLGTKGNMAGYIKGLLRKELQKDMQALPKPSLYVIQD